MGRKKKQIEETSSNNLSLDELVNSVTADLKLEDQKDVLEDLDQMSVLDQIAIGVCKVDNKWAVVEIAFNANTGESDLQDIRIVGNNKQEAISIFKITAVKKGII